MTTFTIDSDNTITAFGSAEEAAAASTTPFDSFASSKELAELVAGWPAERLVAIWNSLPGVDESSELTRSVCRLRSSFRYQRIMLLLPAGQVIALASGGNPERLLLDLVDRIARLGLGGLDLEAILRRCV